MSKNKKNKRSRTATNFTIATAQKDTVQRYGSGIKEHIVGYTGRDNEAGTTQKRSLKSISKSKVNPDDKARNLKEQAGYSAEVKSTARSRAEEAISGKKSRTTRTDDMHKQSDGNGNTVGGTNDQNYDIARTDSNGVYIEGSGRQVKFVGGNAKECTKSLLKKDFDKYRDNNIPIEVPSDFYESVQAELEERAKKLEKQIANAEKKGDYELAKKHREQLDRVNKTRKNLRKSNVTNKEAMEARLHPKLSTAKDIVKVAHRAGIEGAKSGAKIGGGISFIKHSISVIKGDTDVESAIKGVACDTAKAAVTGYGTAAAGSVVKGIMQNAPFKKLQALSKTNLPSYIVTSALDVGKTLSRYAKGEIDGTDCLIELGEKGASMVAGAAGAALGTAILPGIGTLIGSLVGCALCSTYYNGIINVLKEAKLSEQELAHVRAECLEAIETLKKYRTELETATQKYMAEHISAFSEALTVMDIALCECDADSFISGNNAIIRKLNGTPLFKNMSEFDALMMSNAPITI